MVSNKRELLYRWKELKRTGSDTYWQQQWREIKINDMSINARSSDVWKIIEHNPWKQYRKLSG
jgi:hypothetical protein